MAKNKRAPPFVETIHRDARPINHQIDLSQNFLRDSALVHRLVQRAALQPEDTLVEIGPGTGIITTQLIRRCRSVIAIEKDAKLAASLKQRFTNQDNLEIREGDILDVPLPASPFKVFANIPFNITAAIIAKLTELHQPLVDAFLVVQQEAAHRFMGYPAETLTALWLKPWFRLSIAHYFSRQDFAPVPQVETVLLRIERRDSALITRAAGRRFKDFVAYCFVNANPSLYDVLNQLMGREALALAAATFAIRPDMTPTMVDFERWLGLFCLYVQHAAPQAERLIANSAYRLQSEQQALHKRHRTSVVLAR